MKRGAATMSSVPSPAALDVGSKGDAGVVRTDRWADVRRLQQGMESTPKKAFDITSTVDIRR